MEFPEFKLALTEAENNNLQMARSHICFTEGVHSGRTFAEVYECFESNGYTQFCIQTPKLATCYRLYATYSTLRRRSEKDEMDELNKAMYGIHQSASEFQ